MECKNSRCPFFKEHAKHYCCDLCNCTHFEKKKLEAQAQEQVVQEVLRRG